MKTRTKRKICYMILFINFFILLGLAGGCEMEYITIREWIIKSLIVIACSIIPALKSGIFRNK